MVTHASQSRRADFWADLSAALPTCLSIFRVHLSCPRKGWRVFSLPSTDKSELNSLLYIPWKLGYPPQPASSSVKQISSETPWGF